MNSGITYRDMEERKSALQTLHRLEIWLKGEEIVFDHLTPDTLKVIRTVLAGRISSR